VITANVVLLFQVIALQFMLLTWFAYRRMHPQSKALFRIEKTSWANGTVTYYVLRRFPFGVWRVFEMKPGVRGYVTLENAQGMLEAKLTDMGISASETEVVKEYGI